MDDLIQFELESNGIGIITINRPTVRNALNRAAMAALAETVTHAENSPELNVLIMTGAGDQAFISGGDLRDLSEASTEQDGLQQHDLMNDTLTRLAHLPVPVIAALEGATRGGGCEVALAADLRIAAEDATLGFAQIRMGVTPGWGGAHRLYELVGYTDAMELLLTGRTISALEAQMLGIIDRLSNSGKALHEAKTLAMDITRHPPLAIRGIKEVLMTYRTRPVNEGFASERAVFGKLWGSDDHTEAAEAFLEKRKPEFKGR